jgi:hypothetical protein
MCAHASRPVDLAATLGQDGSRSPLQKRLKLSSPSSSTTDRIFFEFEVLKSRVYRLETQLGIPDAVELDQVSSFPKLMGTLDGIGVRAGEVEGYLVSPDLALRMRKTSKTFLCLADNCRAGFSTVGRLHKHIREARGTGHKLLRSCIDQELCPYFTSCPYHGGDLCRHEHEAHGERYHSRLEKLTQFGIYPGKHDT